MLLRKHTEILYCRDVYKRQVYTTLYRTFHTVVPLRGALGNYLLNIFNTDFQNNLY